MPEMVHPCKAIGEAFKQEGVEYVFGVMGGHLWPILDHLAKEGIKIIHMRSEASGGYAAEAYARCKGDRPGICFGTAGPGITNLATAIVQANMCRSPMIAIAGQHPTMEDGRGSLQEGYAEPMFQSATKWSKRLTEPRSFKYFVRKAFYDSVSYPPGPIVLEFPMDTIITPLPDDKQSDYLADWLGGKTIAQSTLQQQTIADIVNLLYSAERPVIVAGEGVYYGQATEELKELVELTQIPVNTRRLTRGAVPEDHPLSFGAGGRSAVLRDADVVFVIGLYLGTLEHGGQWNQTGKFIQLNAAKEHIRTGLRTEIAAVADLKPSLRDMINYIKAQGLTPPDRKEWLGKIQAIMAKARQDIVERAELVKNEKPIHPDWMGKVVTDYICDALDGCTIIYDSFTGTNFITSKITARFAGQVIDAGEFANVGHGIGMGIGAALARPGKPVFVMMGDGGMGECGMDIETAAKYKLPVVYFVHNNNVWISGLQHWIYGENYKWLGPQNENVYGFTGNIHYEKMFADQGVHAECVTEPEELRPALERAFNSGGPAVVNCFVNGDVVQPLIAGPSARAMLWHIPPQELPEAGRRLMYPEMFPGEEPPKTWDPYGKYSKK